MKPIMQAYIHGLLDQPTKLSKPYAKIIRFLNCVKLVHYATYLDAIYEVSIPKLTS